MYGCAGIIWRLTASNNAAAEKAMDSGILLDSSGKSPGATEKKDPWTQRFIDLG